MTTIDEIRNIISFLDVNDLPNICLISKEFNEVATENINFIKKAILLAEDKCDQYVEDYSSKSAYLETWIRMEFDRVTVGKRFYLFTQQVDGIEFEQKILYYSLGYNGKLNPGNNWVNTFVIIKKDNNKPLRYEHIEALIKEYNYLEKVNSEILGESYKMIEC